MYAVIFVIRLKNDFMERRDWGRQHRPWMNAAPGRQLEEPSGSPG